MHPSCILFFLLTVSSESEGEDGEDMDISMQFDEPPPDNTDLNEEEVVEAVNVPPPVPPPETVTPRCPKRQVLVELPITDSGSTTKKRSRPKKTKSMLLKVPSGDSSQSVIDVFSGPDTTDSNTEKSTVSIHVQNMHVMWNLFILAEPFGNIRFIS